MPTVDLSCYRAVADAIAILLSPHAEVVIHDLERDAVFSVANPFTGIRAGDPSHLKLTSDDLVNEGAVIGPYQKVGDRGQSLRSVTAVLSDGDGVAVGLMCINLDYSQQEAALEILEKLVKPATAQSHPEILFRNDWRYQVRQEIQRFQEENHLTEKELRGAANRRKVLARLDQKGLFYARKSMEQIAGFLGVSRATVYNDLVSIRSNQSSGRMP
jgi:predicted transcriptional regulator YheO